MAEAMTVETIIDAYWQFQGYWTKIRYPIRAKPKDKGSWADIDVISYNPEKGHLVISESKVQGTKNKIFAYTKFTRESKRYGRSILDYDDYYFKFLNHIPALVKNGKLFEDFSKMVNTLTIQLVSNYYVSDDVKEVAKQDILVKIKKLIPKTTKTEIRLDTTFDIICEIIEKERESKQGRRYGNPILDIAREINRYMHPEIGYACGGRRLNKDIAKEFKNRISKVLGLEEK